MHHSIELYDRASKHLIGGVNSPVRAFNGVGGTPRFINSANGAYIYDVDGHRYVDYVLSWGPMLLGHNHPAIREAVIKQAEKGLSFGAPTEIEIELAEKICQLMPSMEMVRMVNSGTEATMSAIRLARGATGRDKLIKFEGCYHGHADSLLVKAGSGALTLGEPTSPGVPADFARHTLVAQFNHLDSVESLFAQHGKDVAAVIVEPVAGNMNCILPQPGFLEGLRELCDKHGALLILDEVMCGFRVALGGAQEHFGVSPDLTCLGKVIGGGMPVGAFGGRRDIMEQLAPLGPVYQAGTLSGNPVAMAAGLATLREISQPGFYDPIFKHTTRLVTNLQKLADDSGIAFTTNHLGSMFGLFFTDADSVTDFAGTAAGDLSRFQRFFHLMMKEGIYLAPSMYEAGFTSVKHDDDTLDATLAAAHHAFDELKKN